MLLPKRVAVLCLLSSVLLATTARASTITAATCNFSDVQAAINAAAGGDTVAVPAGTCSWSSTLSFSKGISLIGAGQTGTTITNNVGTLIQVSNTQSNFVRISGFLFNNADNQVSIVSLIGAMFKVRLDHITFNKGDNAVATNWMGSGATGPVYGVVDNSVFHNMKRPYLATDVRAGESTWGTTAWNEFIGHEATFPGSEKMMYFEDDQFVWDSGLTDNNVQGALYGQYGSKAVLRHNTFTGFCTYVDAHGDGPDFGTIMYEIYNNTFTETDPGCGAQDIIGMRGGQSLIHDNTFNVILDPVHLLIYWPTCPAPNYCELPAHRVKNTYIYGNTMCNENGTSCTTNQSSMVVLGDSGQSGSESSSTFIQLNQQYFLAAPSSGQTFYPYTPYTYPHPLRNGATAPSPCDVNNDGATNVADVQLEVNMALGISPCTNLSGTCNVTSVQKVVNAALGGICVNP